jgi:hypothetical protein
MSLPQDQTDGTAGHRILGRGKKQNRRRDVLHLGPRGVIGLRHRLAVGRGVHDRGRDRIDQDAILGDFLAERLRERRDPGLRRGVGGHVRALARLKRGTRRDVDDAPAAPRTAERRDGGPATQIGRDEIAFDLPHQQLLVALADRGKRKAARDVDRGP